MPLLTVRLTDEDYAALKELAGGSSMAELVRAWIAGDHSASARWAAGLHDLTPAAASREDDVAVWATRDRAEAAEAKVLELEAEVKRLKKELAGRPKSYEMTADRFGVTIDPPPTKGSLVTVRATADAGRFGAARPAPKPGKKVR